MATHKPRSLSELPGHLRVPILKRKDTGRTQARLEAGLAGMKELQALREQQQQLVGDTMASVDHKHNHRHNRRHSHSDYMTTGNSKMLRSSSGQSIPSPHDSMSSWQSASSLASISEEGMDNCNISVRQRDNNYIDKNDNCESWYNYINRMYDNEIMGDYPTSHYSSCDTINRNDNNINDGKSYYNINTNQNNISSNGNENSKPNNGNARNSGGIGFTSPIKPSRTWYSWYSQEDLRQYPRNVNHTPTQSVDPYTYYGSQHKPQARSSSHDQNRMSSHSSSVSSDGRLKSRRNSESMICEPISRKHSRTMSIDSLNSNDGNDRQSLTNISNLHRFSYGGSTYYEGDNSFQSQYHKDNGSLNRNQRHISWDNLLKTIGISSSTTSLVAGSEEKYSKEGEDENDVFLDESGINSPKLSKIEKHVPLHKVGRSFSFSYGNTAAITKQQLLILQQKSSAGDGNKVETNVPNQFSLSSPSSAAPHPHQGIQPIMRRASMQCEALITNNSGLARRIVNPIQDMDINCLNSPGPLHAVMLQYTSRELGKDSFNKTSNAHCMGNTRFRKPITLSSTIAQLNEDGDEQENESPNPNQRPLSAEMKDDQLDGAIKTFNSYSKSNPSIQMNDIVQQKGMFPESNTKRTWSPRQERPKRRISFNRRRDAKNQSADITEVQIHNASNDSPLSFSNVDNSSDISSISHDQSSESPVNGDEVKKERRKLIDNRKNGGDSLYTQQVGLNTHHNDYSKLEQQPSDVSIPTIEGDNNNINVNENTVPINNGHANEPNTNGNQYHHNERQLSISTTSNVIFTKDMTEHAEVPNPSNTLKTFPKHSESSCPGNFSKCPSDDKNKHLRFSVTSSDVSLISDEGYSTCESLSPITKSRKSNQNSNELIHDNSTPGSDSQFKINKSECINNNGKATETISKVDSESKNRLGNYNSTPALLQNGFHYEKVKTLDQGAAVVWNQLKPTSQSMYEQRNAVLKLSCKQTAV